MRRDDIGIHGLSKVEYEIRDGEIVWGDTGPVRVMVTERQPAPRSEPTLRDLSEGLVASTGPTTGFTVPRSSRGSPT
jgi:hypothetical protein